MRRATFMKMSNPRIDSSPREAKVTTFVPLGIDRAADLPRCWAWAVKLRVDAVEVHFNLGMKSWRKRLLLPLGRRVSGVAIDQRRQSRGVDRAREKRRGLGRRQVDPVRDVAVAPGEIVFAVDDDRAVEHFAEEQAGAPRPPWATTRSGRRCGIALTVSWIVWHWSR